MRILRSWWVWAVIALIVILGLAVVFGPKFFALLVAPLAAAASSVAIALGADKQISSPSRPRRGGVGGSPTQKPGVVKSETETSNTGRDEPANPAPRPNRPARPGF
jgi:hypothetical protein